jgi:hypothetical protein
MSEQPTLRMARRHSRRSVLASGAALAAAGAAGGAALVLSRGGGGPPAAPEGTATPTLWPTPTPAPPGYTTVRFTTGAFEQRSFAPGELIDWSSGAFVMDIRNGAVTGWRVAAAPTDYSPAVLQGRGRFVVWYGGLPPSGAILDRKTGREITWDGERVRLVLATSRFLIFTEPGMPEWFDSGQFFVIDPETLAPRWRVDLKPQPHRRWLDAGDDGSHLVTVEDWELPQHVFWIDLGRQAAEELIGPEPDGRKFQVLSIMPERNDGFQLTLQYYRETADGNVGEPSLTLQRFRSDGERLDSHPTEYWGFSNRSPDGRFVLREQVLREVPPSDVMEPGEVWTAAVMSNEIAGDLWRLRSVSLSYGDFPPVNRWLADSSGFTAAVSPGDPGARVDVRHAIISTGGFITELLPQPPGVPGAWWQHPWYLTPVPSPSDPDLVAMGRVHLYNRRSGAWLIPNLPADPGPAHVDPWASTWSAGQELTFSLPHGGHDGARPPVLIAHHREAAGFPQPPPMTFRVRATGSCLNFREGPGLESAVTACIPDGQRLTLVPTGPRDLGVAWTADGTWVSTATDSGQHGWVSADYLAWDV